VSERSDTFGGFKTLMSIEDLGTCVVLENNCHKSHVAHAAADACPVSVPISIKVPSGDIHGEVSFLTWRLRGSCAPLIKKSAVS